MMMMMLMLKTRRGFAEKRFTPACRRVFGQICFPAAQTGCCSVCAPCLGTSVHRVQATRRDVHMRAVSWNTIMFRQTLLILNKNRRGEARQGKKTKKNKKRRLEVCKSKFCWCAALKVSTDAFFPYRIFHLSTLKMSKRAAKNRR